MKLNQECSAVVTGASRGIGRHIAHQLASRQVKLVLAARNEQDLNDIKRELSVYNNKVSVVKTDVLNKSDLHNLYDKSIAAYGSIDILVNNAGIEAIQNYDSLSGKLIEQIISVNLTAPMLLSQLFLNHMQQQNSGHIVNIASAAGMFPPPFSEPYAASKAGLIAFTHSLRMSLKQQNSRVSSSAITPGFVDGEGMYENGKSLGGEAPWYVGSIPIHKVATAVINAIEKDIPEQVLVPGMPKVAKTLQLFFPRGFETMSKKLNLFKTLVEVAKTREQVS
ncbi:SDR family NAD(P)-dependent oxidoreductase [Zooshikella sp. RANM57]|uniref:SDR family NAD(P)-dependent oxidoreductase n=1 Tax=Zooshikella sp. RANM57 TaxID=3425863 RepID=UPI003D6E4A47